MKKYLITLLTLFVLLAPNVKAETIKISQSQKYEDLTYCGKNSCNEDYATVMNEFMQERNATKYKYYAIWYEYAQANKIWMYQWNDDSYEISITNNKYLLIRARLGKGFYTVRTEAGDGYIYSRDVESESPILINVDLSLLDTNFKFVNEGVSYEISGIYDDSISITPGMVIPSYNELKKYNSWKEFPKENSRITTVNLDDYEYVILNLKDYNQTKAFNTNLKVKGSIGITPIYNFGQTAKDDIMGSKVQDRCNVKYDDYTDYRLSILKQDLQNNSFYVVKGCEVGSSFKFDNTIFDITYVDENNKSDPIVSIGGKDYHVIPFDKLPSSANKNEEENYVPGESERFALLDKLDFLINNLNRVWDAFTSFMGFVGKMFSTLPDEFKAIAISSFTIGCTLMIFKIIKSLK